MKRSEIKRKTPLKRGKPLPRSGLKTKSDTATSYDRGVLPMDVPVVKKESMASRDLKWSKAVRARDNGCCRKCGKFVGDSIDTHHVRQRSTAPDLRHDVDNGQSLCRLCHSWVHDNIAESEKLGFLASSEYEMRKRKNR